MTGAVPTPAVAVPPLAAPPGGGPPATDAATAVQVVAARSDDQPRTGATPGLRPSGSSLEEHTFVSPTLGEEMLYLVYLPPGYEETDRRYPSVYMLHGVAGGPGEWPEIGIPDAADRLIADGTIQPMVIVFPNADASYYVNGATSGLRWQDYLVGDVVAHVDTTYRTFPRSESRAVSGLSMGGDGALQLAMRFPDVFRVAAAHSPSSRLLFEHAAADVYGSEAYFRAHNPFWLAQEVNPEIGVKIWIDVGDEDPWRWNARAIHAALEARGLEHEFNLFPGLHDGDYWVAHVDDYLQFYDRALVSQ